jgi:sugar phosphate isomerase/epimerase
MLSITTDYAKGTGDPSPSLKRIAAAGFSHVHWCHQWSTDFVYAACEVAQIAAWLREFGLSVLDLHGSIGVEKCWASDEAYRREAGVELVANRLEMTARLGGGVVIMHTGYYAGPDKVFPTAWDSLKRSLDELQPLARKLGVRIAIENGNWPMIHAILGAYPPDFLGLCYDSGHGNVDRVGLDQLARLKDRLISIHLHDNDGSDDQHRLPFSGNVDWARLTAILKASSYKTCISMESTMRTQGISSEEEFLAQAFSAGTRLTAMLAG